jgi:DNA-directed RNA polymerase specialized sigma24 family protein
VEPTTSTELPHDPLALLADSINRNDGPAWEAFLTRYRPLIRRVFAARAGAAHADEFLDWFPGWFYHGQRVHAAYRSCLRAQADGRCPDPETVASFLENYLAKCVASALADFFKESASPQIAPAMLDSLATPSVSRMGEVERVEAALEQLPPEIRVPFRLRYWHSLRPLRRAEEEWVAQVAGCGPDEVRRRIDQKARANQELDYPLDATFIGRLLRLQPRADGSYNNIVDQRVRRARDRLRKLLS